MIKHRKAYRNTVNPLSSKKETAIPKRQLLRITALCLGLFMSSSLARAQDSPLATALEYLTQNVKALGLTEADLADLVVTDQYVSTFSAR